MAVKAASEKTTATKSSFRYVDCQTYTNASVLKNSSTVRDRYGFRDLPLEKKSTLYRVLQDSAVTLINASTKPSTISVRASYSHKSGQTGNGERKGVNN